MGCLFLITVFFDSLAVRGIGALVAVAAAGLLVMMEKRHEHKTNIIRYGNRRRTRGG
jgi:hypothetical protein